MNTRLLVDELSSSLNLYTLANSTKKNAPQKQANNANNKTKKQASKKAKPVLQPVNRELVLPNLSADQNNAIANASQQQMYLTTAINYTNGAPHVGHMYEAVTSDIIARYHRAYGRDVMFLTGSDEHGQKVEASAEKAGVEPIKVCDKYVEGFKKCNSTFKVSNDRYIRTTDPKHEELARKVWGKVKDKGDIYLGKYEGWYNMHEEEYVADKDAEMMEFKDEHGRPLERKSESSYFFKMSKYQQALIDHIEKNPLFIQPQERRSDMLSFLQKNTLNDLCISRTVCQWGIQCPHDPEYTGTENHVMYVWFDALTNYLSGVGYLTEDPASKYWPANVHIIGKDITRFHTIYWPSMLMSAGIPLPKSVFGHGFVLDKDNVKMSKTLQNIIDPMDLAATYPIDTIRFYTIRDTVYGSDLPFNVESMVNLHNANLNNGLGNLLSRAVNLCKLHCGGKVPDEPAYKHQGSFPFDVEALRKECEVAMSVIPDPSQAGVGLQLQNFCRAVVDATSATNKYLTDTNIWHLSGDEHKQMRVQVVRAVLEALYVIGVFFQAIVVDGAQVIFQQIGVAPTKICALSANFDNLPPGTLVKVGPGMYSALVVGGAAAAAAKNKAKGFDFEAAKEAKRLKQAALKAKQKQAAVDPNQPVFSMLDIRVGKIVKAWPHPDADKLYCEEIDVGEDKPRQIASGLRAHYSVEEMQGKDVLVVCNLKPSKMVGFTSAGMVLCAKSADKVEFVTAPAGSKPGDRITIEGVPADKYTPAAPNQVKKKKVWETVATKLGTNGDKVVCWDGKVLLDGQGNKCVAPTLPNVPVA